MSESAINTTIKNRIQDDMKESMRNKDSARLGTIRLLMAAIKQREVDERITLDDAEITKVLNKMIKQRRESIAQYEVGNRPDLVQKEQDEINLLQVYLPQQMSEAEVTKEVQQAIQQTQASSAKEMGKVMGILKTKLAGKADMTLVSNKVKELLGA